MGDFNFPPDDYGWQVDELGWVALIQPPLKTTIASVSLYDNIWIDPKNTTEYTGSYGIYEFDNIMYPGNRKTASREVSDHRPIWFEVTIDKDDDPDEYGDLSHIVIGVGELKNESLSSESVSDTSENRDADSVAVYHTK